MYIPQTAQLGAMEVGWRSLGARIQNRSQTPKLDGLEVGPACAPGLADRRVNMADRRSKRAVSNIGHPNHVYLFYLDLPPKSIVQGIHPVGQLQRSLVHSRRHSSRVLRPRPTGDQNRSAA